MLSFIALQDQNIIFFSACGSESYIKNIQAHQFTPYSKQIHGKPACSFERFIHAGKKTQRKHANVYIYSNRYTWKAWKLFVVPLLFLIEGSKANSIVLSGANTQQTKELCISTGTGRIKQAIHRPFRVSTWTRPWSFSSLELCQPRWPTASCGDVFSLPSAAFSNSDVWLFMASKNKLVVYVIPGTI